MVLVFVNDNNPSTHSQSTTVLHSAIMFFYIYYNIMSTVLAQTLIVSDRVVVIIFNMMPRMLLIKLNSN